jgi:mannosyltransferase
VLVTLLAILALAAFLRFYDLGEESLWHDELYILSLASAEDAVSILTFLAAEEKSAAVYPPGYFLLLHYWRDLAGESEAALRFPSAVAGVLSVLVVYLLGRRLYSEAEGLAAALFIAVLRWPIQYSQETHSYSLLLLFSTLSTYFWWGCFRNLRGSRRLPLWEAIGYAVSAVVLSYLHYFGVLLVAIQAVALLLLAARTAPRALLLYTPVALAYLPWIPAMLYQGGHEFWLWLPTYRDVVWFLRDIFNYEAGLSLLAFTLLSLGAVHALYDLRGRELTLERLLPSGLLMAWFVMPPALSFVLSYVFTPLFFPRYFIVCLPAVYLLLAHAVHRLFGRSLAGAALIAALAVAFLGNLVFDSHFYARAETLGGSAGIHRNEYREAAAYASSHAGPNTLMAQCGWGGYFSSFPDRYDYYFERIGSVEKPGPQVCNQEELQAFLEALENGNYDRLIYLRMHVPGTEGATQALRDRFGSPHREDFVGGEVWVYDVKE